MIPFQKLRDFPDITTLLYTDDNDNWLYIKRDDLIPFSFGGNKAVIAEAQVEDMLNRGFDVMVGYGNSRSNLCRVLSNLCKKEGIPCMIISPYDEDGSYTPSFNASFSSLTDAAVLHCKKQEAGNFISQVKEDLKKKGHNPYFVYDIENVNAPLQAMAERYGKLTENYDYIFLPTGTGITVSGLLTGNIREILSGKSPSERHTRRIVSISVARTRDREMPFISSYVRTAGEDVGQWYDENGGDIFDFCDSYTGMGYGLSNPEINSVIDSMYSDFGIPLDPTYTGKAFYGMQEYIKKHNIHDKKILFWHTGGLPLFFDSKEKL